MAQFQAIILTTDIGEPLQIWTDDFQINGVNDIDGNHIFDNAIEAAVNVIKIYLDGNFTTEQEKIAATDKIQVLCVMSQPVMGLSYIWIPPVSIRKEIRKLY